MKPSSISSPWLSSSDPMDQWDMGSLDQLIINNIWEDSIDTNYSLPLPMPKKLAAPKSETNSWDSSVVDVKPKMPPTMLTFGAPSHDISVNEAFIAGSKRNYATMAAPATRSSSSNKEHVMAERKRREKLTQKFISLSAILPGLKKLDKASVLGDAIKYVKQLQEQVKNLENQAAKGAVVKPIIVKNKTQILPATEDGNSSCDENFETSSAADHNLPVIEVKQSEQSVLIKIQCQRGKGVVAKVFSEIEESHISVVNTSVMSFAGSLLDITVTAQVEEGFSISVKDIVKNLNSALVNGSG